jgi:flagellar biosynthetic protein FliP
VLIGIALFMSFFIMSPVLDRINNEALQPYLAETIGAKEALEKASCPFTSSCWPRPGSRISILSWR